MNTKSRLVPVILGALVTLALGAIVVMVVFKGCSTLLAVLAAFLCSLIGGFLATRLAQVRELTTGALSGLVAGLIAVVLAALVTKGMNTTLVAGLATIIFVAGGTLGGWLTRVRLSLEK